MRSSAAVAAAVTVSLTTLPLRAADDSASHDYSTARLSSAAFVAGAEIRSRLRHEEQEIFRALQARVSFDFKGQSLQQALNELAGDIPLRIDEVSLTEEGIALHARVNGRLQNITVDTALRRILAPFGLTFAVEQHALIVTSWTEARERARLDTFDVAPLLEQARRLNRRLSQRDRRLLFDDADVYGNSENEWLPVSLRGSTSGEWKEIDGIGGTIMLVGDKLLVRQNYAVLEEIRGILDALQEAASGRLGYGSAIIHPAGYPRGADEKVFNALVQQVSARYTNRPIEDVLDDLGKRTGVPIWIDSVAWTEEGLSSDEPVSVELPSAPLHALLTALLRDLGLTWYVDRGTLVVTTETEAGELLRSALYDARDLYAVGIDGTILIDAVQSFTSGEWEEIDGVGGTIQMPFAGIVLVRQTHRVLDEIDALLADLRYRSPAAPPVRFVEPTAPRGRGSSSASSSSSSRSGFSASAW
jgi:hypothetical protein